MKKFIITEEERSRILGMHQSATSKQYLKEETGYDSLGGGKINDGPGAYNYFMGIINKTGKLDIGTAWLGKNTYWVVTQPWQESTGNAIQGDFARFTMRGIVKRNGLYFDVSNDDESITSFKLVKTNAEASLFAESGNESANWLPNTQTLKSNVAGTPGGNMGLVGGLANFKSMVKNLPNKDFLLKNYVNASAQPNFKNAVPQDQMDLYPTSTQQVKPTTPIKP